MREWKTYRLGDLIDVNKNSINKNIKYDVIEYLDTASVTENRFSDFQKISLDDAPSRAKRIVKENDIIYSTVRPILRHYGIVKNVKPNSIVSTGFAVLSAKKIDPNFLFYYLTTDEVVYFLNSVAEANTTTYPAFNASLFENIEVTIPENINTQTQIAQILTSLDDKIELNLQMNQTLEAMAQALFKEWFVDFKFYGFDGELVNGLPKGWRMGKVGEIFYPKRGRNITKSEAIEGIFPVVAGGLEPSCYHNESNTKEPVITISSSGANAGFVRLYQTPVWSADSCFIDSSIFPFVHFCYMFLKSNQKNIYDSQEGSAQPHIYPRHIMDLNICVGNESVVQKFEEIVTPFFEKMKYNSLQIQSLTQTRDTLLPKLMCGKIKVKA